MSSLPGSFTCGFISGVHSARDALASYGRSQYCPSSNVQPSDLSDDLSDDSPAPSEPAGASDVDGSFAERHPPRTPQAVRRMSSPNLTRVYWHESTPLLKKATSFMVFSTNTTLTPATHTDYGSLSYAGGHPDPQNSTPITSAGTVEYHRKRKSTYIQTLYNCIAVLLGIGMFSEPLAFAYAGWFWGTVLNIFFGLTTCYTVKFLAREILQDSRLDSYADIGQKAFGPKLSLLINVLLCLEFFSVSVALITLAADTLEGVWPTYSANTYKVISLPVLAPTLFMPFPALSLTSRLGIASTLLIIAVIFIDGFSKSDSPGSLWSPAHTSVSPGTFGEVGVAFGLFMAGFSGHVVIPSLARNMEDPSQFDHMANWAYLITTFIYSILGYTGYIMFGKSVSDEISRDLLSTPGYNSTLNQIMMWSLVIIPLSKFALSTRPLNDILESTLGLENNAAAVSVESGKGSLPEGEMSWTKRLLVALERIMVLAMSILVSILIPQFSSVMAFLGSFSAFVLCVIGPITAKIVMTGHCPWYDIALLSICTLMAVWGTFCAFRS